ncbi:MAG: hypothetical protein IJ795_00655 [Bacteroidales bacterium]|nr:hypothetical protein [Bacteroidales bacterium]
MKKHLILSAVLLLAGLAAFAQEYTISDDSVSVTIDSKARLTSLRSLSSGKDYAGGEGLWRIFYNNLKEKEIQVSSNEQQPSISMEGETICIDYPSLKCRGEELAFSLHLRVYIQDGQVRFDSALENNEPHTIIRELHYPLAGNLQIPSDYKMLTTHTGGQLFDDPVDMIVSNGNRFPYMTPAQKFRQYDVQYPRNLAANCFAFTGEKDGLYFGSHDLSFQETWHGFRVYPDENGDFKRIEAGFYKYPNCLTGGSWSCNANLVQPYDGDWKQTSRIYREWADTWWDHREPAGWVKRMTGWQRVIFKHQYGEYLFRYEDMPRRVKDAGRSVGANTLMLFGWWRDGMDHGNPDYYPDETQGGVQALKSAIASFREGGDRVILYYNGRLIDRESGFYRSGQGKEVCNHDNFGAEYTEHYKFTGEGTFLGYHDTRTFVVADTRSNVWKERLAQMADQAIGYGVDAVFYDQLGAAEEFPQWDLSGEFPVPNIYSGQDKSRILRTLRDKIKAANPEIGLGTEWLSDCTSQYCDFVHIVEFTALPESFPDWFRYTFPEVIFTDRTVRDDTDIERRVGNTLLKGLRNDIEVYRCRGLIDQTPHYQQYLAKVNEIRLRWPELLLEGRFTFDEGFSCSGKDLVARSYTCGDSIAVVVTTYADKARGRISVPGYELSGSAVIGDGAKASGRGQNASVSLGKYDIAVLVFKK